MSNKPPIVPNASDYLADWCNGKIKFEDALREFAKAHVTAAGHALAHDIRIIQPTEPGGRAGAMLNLDAYPLTNIV